MCIMWYNKNQIRQEQELELNLFSFYTMTSNVLPSAPDEEQHLYPVLTGNDFRMQKVNEVSAALNAEVAHYRTVAKKYKRTKKVTNWCAVGSTVFFYCYFKRQFSLCTVCCGASCRYSAWRCWRRFRSCFLWADCCQQKA